MIADLAPAARRRRARGLPVCPSCGSFTDAPRRSPETGRPDRWCRACLRWCGSPSAATPSAATATAPTLTVAAAPVAPVRVRA